MSNLSEYVKRKLWTKFKDISGSRVNAKGYVSKPELNLIQGVRIEDFQVDLHEGSGNEMQSKFLAVHSSTALVANTFGIWKSRPQNLKLCGLSGFSRITFEKKCPTGLRGTPPNLDLHAENEANVIGVKSKIRQLVSWLRVILNCGLSGENHMEFTKHLVNLRRRYLLTV